MKIMLAILLCSVSLAVTAQEKKDKKANWENMKKYMPQMTKSVGISLQKFDGLRDRLAGFPQYAPIKNHIWTISAGSMHNINNFISHMGITAGSSLTGNPDKKSSAMRILGGSLDLGYDVIPAERVMVYPMVGIGGETYHALLYKDVSANDFNDVANSPGLQNSIRSVKFVNSFFTYRLGLGIALKSPGGYGSIGLQGTYIGGFQRESWESAEYQALANAPSDELRRVQISLVFTGGMGSMMRK